MNESNKTNRKSGKYFLTQKYISKLIKNMYLNIFIVLLFFVIFNILYSTSPMYSTIRIVLIIIFAIAGVYIVILCERSIAKHKAFYYQVTGDALIHFNGKKEIIYPWLDFKSIVRDENKLDMMYPIVFKTNNRILVLNKNVENNDRLISDIVKHTNGIAEIDTKVLEEFE